MDQLLSTLPIASEAAFNSFNNQHEPTCLRNTRAELLQEIEEWADGVDERCVFWLNGLAGTGKSTVARTIARTYHDRNALGASFFFSRGGGDLSVADKLVTTLARQLANRIPLAKRYVCEAIMEQQVITDHSLRDHGKSAPSKVVFVVDALDERDSEKDVRAILKVLVTARSLSNIRLRIFLTSRPEIPVRLGFGKLPEARRQVLVLHEISAALVDRDLRLFFENNFSRIREERGFEADWPSKRIIKRLVEIAYGLFIWASTGCRFIREGKRLAMRRIRVLLREHHADAGPEKQLDQIYTTVLRASIQQGYTDEEKAEVYDTLREVLGSVVLLLSPLSMESLSMLIDIPLSHVKGDACRFAHNISHPQPVFRPTQCVPSELQYACLYWVEHLRKSGVHLFDGDTVRHFFQKYFLNWIEAINLMGKSAEMAGIIRLYQSLLVTSFMDKISSVAISPDGRLLAAGSDDWTVMVWDLRTRAVCYTIKAHSGWINSVLFSPNGKLLASASMDETVGVWDAATGYEPKRFNNRSSCINSAALSPDSSLIATGSMILDGHLGPVNSGKFSSNGKRIVSGSDDMTIRLWDTVTGTECMSFRGHTKRVWAVTFSAETRLVVSGSEDKAIRIWDTLSGSLLHTLRDSTSGISSVAFSPDGQLLAAGSFNDEVRLWDMQAWRLIGQLDDFEHDINPSSLVDPKLQGEPKGHSSAITCVIFSPDGRPPARRTTISAFKRYRKHRLKNARRI
ncbi:WD40-repeat-containing domain protein [Lophiotrema nucula]|uniref:Mitochondrial division protein 1 n=1 Tax=Lophiotrema nucula TaxID=690887 RepID=A0A6A5Z6T3_9PLEO|nr:WD40-repeat-containing domain protein [Lophiotrema nucula]